MFRPRNALIQRGFEHESCRHRNKAWVKKSAANRRPKWTFFVLQFDSGNLKQFWMWALVTLTETASALGLMSNLIWQKWSAKNKAHVCFGAHLKLRPVRQETLEKTLKLFWPWMSRGNHQRIQLAHGWANKSKIAIYLQTKKIQSLTAGKHRDHQWVLRPSCDGTVAVTDN